MTTRFLLLSLICLTGCEGERVESPATADAQTAETTATDSATGDAAETPPGGECGEYKGAKMVRVGSYCIDSTEVTRGQFLAFLAAPTMERNAKRPAECAWNNTDPTINATAAFLGFPVDDTNFCDAMTYCAWANKRLCGRIGGGPSNTAELNDHTKSEWFAVCSVNGTQAYPYGNTYSEPRCFTLVSTIEATGSRTGCAGAEAPYSQVFDLSGNAFEWENSCTGSPTATTTRCRVRGGGWSSGNDARCDADNLTNVDVRLPGYGFRCCKD